MTSCLRGALRRRPLAFFQSGRAFSTHELARNLIRGDRVALSRSITLVESSLAEHRAQSEDLLDLVSREISKRKSSIRVGISGSPGVGKSSFIESIGGWLVSRGTKVAVLVRKCAPKFLYQTMRNFSARRSACVFFSCTDHRPVIHAKWWVPAG